MPCFSNRSESLGSLRRNLQDAYLSHGYGLRGNGAEEARSKLPTLLYDHIARHSLSRRSHTCRMKNPSSSGSPHERSSVSCANAPSNMTVAFATLERLRNASSIASDASTFPKMTDRLSTGSRHPRGRPNGQAVMASALKSPRRIEARPALYFYEEYFII